MILNKIRLINFRNHRDSTFEFSPGKNVLLGANGSGKSSVLEAIGICFGYNRTTLKETLRYGSDTTTIQLWFTYHSNKAILTRSWGATTNYVLRYEGREYLGRDSVFSQLSVMLPAALFGFISVRQFAKLWPFDLTARERTDAFNKLLGLDVLEKEWEWWGQVAKVGKERLSTEQAKSLSTKDYPPLPYLLSRKAELAEEMKLAQAHNQEAMANKLRRETLLGQLKTYSNELHGLSKTTTLPLADLDRASHDYSYKVGQYLIAQERIKEIRAVTLSEVCPTCGQTLSAKQLADRQIVLMTELQTLEKLSRPKPLQLPPSTESVNQQKERLEHLIAGLELDLQNIPEGSTVDLEKLREEQTLVDIQIHETRKENPDLIRGRISRYKSVLAQVDGFRENLRARQAVIPEQARLALNQASTGFLRQLFGRQLSSITLDETFLPHVAVRGSTIPFTSLSGAESIVVTLALRLALAKYLAGGSTLLFLDEPTDALDTEARELMYQLNFPGQVFIITHDDNFDGYKIDVERSIRSPETN